MIRLIRRKLKTAHKIFREEGPARPLIVVLEKINNKVVKNKRIDINMLVKKEDVLKADLTNIQERASRQLKNNKIAYWVMSPPGKGSGGHQNIFRFIQFLEKQGYKCEIFLYSAQDTRPVYKIIKDMGSSYTKIKAPMQWLQPRTDLDKACAVFATGWETAYPVYNRVKKARKFYFVQDFEPFFYPVGSEYVLAENSYRMGFFGITAGKWLAQKLHDDYGMDTDFYEFASDNNFYRFENKSPRKEVFFYARPVTTRRGFELGILALARFHEMHPEIVINLAGWDVSQYDIPFPYINLDSLDISDLSSLYNRCAVGLVISLTNMSLLPLELLSCGTIPVVNAGKNNQLVSSNPYIHFAEPNPAALAKAMSDIIKMKNLPEHAAKAAKSVLGNNWDNSGAKFVEAFEKEMEK